MQKASEIIADIFVKGVLEHAKPKSIDQLMEDHGMSYRTAIRFVHDTKFRTMSQDAYDILLRVALANPSRKANKKMAVGV